MIVVENVRYRYPDGTEALKGVSFEVERGEKVAIVGRNGSGKTTLLMAICGLIKFDGRIEVCGVDVRDEKRIRKIVGMVFQNPDDQVFLTTVFDDIAFGPKNLGMDDVEGRVKRVLRLLGIEHLRNRNPSNLSGGEKKKVAIAGILAMDPEVLLVDEPTACLDHEGICEIFNILEELSSLGKTIVIATHDLEFATSWADRILVMDGGTIVDRDAFEIGWLRIPSKVKLKDLLGISRFSEVLGRGGRLIITKDEADYCYGIVDFSNVKGVEYDLELIFAESLVRDVRVNVSERLFDRFLELARDYGVEVTEK